MIIPGQLLQSFFTLCAGTWAMIAIGIDCNLNKINRIFFGRNGFCYIFAAIIPMPVGRQQKIPMTVGRRSLNSVLLVGQRLKFRIAGRPAQIIPMTVGRYKAAPCVQLYYFNNPNTFCYGKQ